MKKDYQVFVVEDDFSTNTIISNLLRNVGYEVTSVLHGSLLLELLEANPPQKDSALLLIDYYLGDYNGDQLITAFNERGIKIPFIFFTSDNDIRLAVKMMKKGARDFLIKSIEAIEMIPEKVTRIINEIEREKKLHQSEERYKLLFENASDAILLLKDKEVVDCNKRTLSMFGCTSREVIGSTPLAFSPENQPGGVASEKMLKQVIRKALKGTPQYFEWQYITKSGKSFYTSVSLNRTNLPDADMMVVIRDISKLKKVEEELQYEKLFAEAVIKTAQAIILVLDPEGRIVSYNPFMEKISGYPLEEVKGKLWFSTFLPTIDHEKIKHIFKNTLNDVDTKGTINPILTKEGELRYIEWNNKKTVDSKKKTLYVVSIGQDITEKIKSEEAARLQEQKLIQSEKMAALGVLVSGIAHEINNPNNFILLSAEAVHTSLGNISHKDFSGGKHKDKDSARFIIDESQSFIENIIEGSNRIKKIINSLKEFSRKDNENWNQPVSVNTIIKSAILIVTNVIKKSTDHFTVTYSSDIPITQGNIQQLELVIINLILNACQALTSRNNKVDVSTEYDAKKNCICIKVNDEGEGIPKKRLSRIIEPFYTTKMDSGGTGMGLAISYSIIKKFNGTLEIESKVNTGTRVTVLLPVIDPQKENSDGT